MIEILYKHYDDKAAYIFLSLRNFDPIRELRCHHLALLNCHLIRNPR